MCIIFFSLWSKPDCLFFFGVDIKNNNICSRGADGGPYRPCPPSGRAQRAPRPRWSRTCSLNTLGTGTFARPANRKPGNGGRAVWLPCWSAAKLQCLLSTVGGFGGGGEAGAEGGRKVRRTTSLTFMEVCLSAAILPSVCIFSFLRYLLEWSENENRASRGQ